MMETHKLEKTCRFLEKVLASLKGIKKNPENLEKRLLFISSLIEKLPIKSSYLSYLHASLLFYLGQLTDKKTFFLSAQTKMQGIEEDQKEYDLLCGKILLSLVHYIDDEKYIEDAIKKFLNVESAEAFWCLGLSHICLGKRSFEVSDFNKAIEFFERVEKCDFPLFWVDYAEGLYILGSFTHHEDTLQRSIEILKRVIVDAETLPFSTEHALYGKDERGYAKTWTLYIKALKRMLELKEGYPQDIDSHFFDAISAVPSEKILWTEWSELYIRQGWIKKDFTLIEKGLSHISHTFFGKVTLEKENPESQQNAVGRWFEPIIFAEALATLGLFAEELKLIKEAEKVIQVALEVLPYNAEVWHASGILHLVYGLYYSDKKYLLESIRSFRKGLEIYNRSFFLWHGLFEAYFSVAILENDEKYFQKAIDTNEYLLKLRPNSPLLHHEQALILLQYGMDDEDLLHAACEKFEEVLALENDQNNPNKQTSKYIFRYVEALDRLGEITGHSMYFEKGIDVLSRMHELGDQSPASQYSLGKLYAHLGEEENDEECLYRAHYLFESCSKKRSEDEDFYWEWGNVLLHLADLKGVSTLQGKKLSVKAEEKFIKSLEYGNSQAHYLLACLYSLTSHFEFAMEHLYRAHEKAVLPSLSDIEQDEWLEQVRNTMAFQKFAEGCRYGKS